MIILEKRVRFLRLILMKADREQDSRLVEQVAFLISFQNGQDWDIFLGAVSPTIKARGKT